MLAAIVAVALTNSVVGLDWGLPYQWHTDEKVTQALNVLHSPRRDPEYFINPHLHIYLTAAAFRTAFAIDGGHTVAQTLPDIFPMLDRASPARRVQFLAMRLARGLSVLFGVATVLLAFAIGRHHWDVATGLLAAAFAAVTMGLVNLWHFATPEALLFLLMLAALRLFDAVMARDAVHDYLLAGICVGLACSTKYTAWILAVPFAVAHVAGHGRAAFGASGLRKLMLAVAAGGVAFLAGTPLIIADWRQFWEYGVVYNWYTGAPTGSLLEVKRSYGPYLALLVDGLGWPLFALAVVGLIGHARAWQKVQKGTVPFSVPFSDPSRRGYVLHAVWIVSFYAFYGLSPHHALRFIMPVAPSLDLLAAAGAVTVVRSQRRPAGRRLAIAGVTAVLVYSAIYTARADQMFLEDTRYAAGKWFAQPSGPARVDYFEIEAYLPYFDPPPKDLEFVPFVEHVTLHHADFWNTAHAYLRQGPAPIVDSDFYYDRYLDEPRRYPERAEFYRHLLTGTDPSGYKPIARFTFTNPWWLNPRPERIAPEVVVFDKTTGGR